MNCRTCHKRRRIRGKSAPVSCVCQVDVWGPDPRDWWGRLIGAGYEAVDVEVGGSGSMPASSQASSNEEPVALAVPPREPPGWVERQRERHLQEDDDQRDARLLNGSYCVRCRLGSASVPVPPGSSLLSLSSFASTRGFVLRAERGMASAVLHGGLKCAYDSTCKKRK